MSFYSRLLGAIRRIGQGRGESPPDLDIQVYRGYTLRLAWGELTITYPHPDTGQEQLVTRLYCVGMIEGRQLIDDIISDSEAGIV